MCSTAEACLYPKGLYNKDWHEASPLLGCLHAVCTQLWFSMKLLLKRVFLSP